MKRFEKPKNEDDTRGGRGRRLGDFAPAGWPAAPAPRVAAEEDSGLCRGEDARGKEVRQEEGRRRLRSRRGSPRVTVAPPSQTTPLTTEGRCQSRSSWGDRHPGGGYGEDDRKGLF